MKIRDWLRKAWRRLMDGEGERSIDNVDALTTMGSSEGFNSNAAGHADAPPNWVPSQQDWGRPRH